MTDTLIFDSALRLLGDHADAAAFAAVERGEWPAGLWKALVGAGFHDFPCGLTTEDDCAGAMALYHAQGRTAAPVPLLEAHIAAWLGHQSNADAVTLAALPRTPQQTAQVIAAWPAHATTLACTSDGCAPVSASASSGITRSYCGEPQGMVQAEQAQWQPFASGISFNLIWQIGRASCRERVCLAV